jgi:hypothetical protein
MFNRISNFIKNNNYSVNTIKYVKENKLTTFLAIYGFVRSIYINENTLKYDSENKDYRSLLKSEKIFYTLGQTILSNFIWPLYIYNDACMIEKKYKNMKIDESDLYMPYFYSIWKDQYDEKIKELRK